MVLPLAPARGSARDRRAWAHPSFRQATTVEPPTPVELGEGLREALRPSVIESPSRHWLTIGFDAKGIPISLFTLNSWVTGDLMLGRALSWELLSNMELPTGYEMIDAVIESTVRWHLPELVELMSARDRALTAHAVPHRLEDSALELLSELPIDVDARVRTLR